MATLTAWNKKDIKTIVDSEKFDLDFYFSENPDVKNQVLILLFIMFFTAVRKTETPTKILIPKFTIIFTKTLLVRTKTRLLII